MNEPEKRVISLLPTKPEPKTTLKQISIENFKCFKDPQDVGPFLNITGIVGGNGSGKSTVLDAISFVLAKDLILKTKNYKYSNIKNSKTGSSNSSSNSPIRVTLSIISDNNQINFKRELHQDDRSKFFVNETELEMEEYLERLRVNHLFGFLVISQEELQVFTSKTPRELTGFLEKISGSEVYRKPYDQLEKNIRNLGNEIVEKNEKLRALKRDKKYSKSLIQSSETVREYYDQLDETEKDVFDLTLLDFHKELQEGSAMLDQLKVHIQKSKNEIDQISSQIIEQNLIKKKAKTNLNYREKKMSRDKIEKELLNEVNLVKILDFRNGQADKSLDDFSCQMDVQEQLLEKRKKEKAEVEKSVLEIEKQIARIKELKNSKYSKMTIGNKNFESFILDLTRQEIEGETLEEQLKSVSAELETAKKRLGELTHESRENSKKIDLESINLAKLLQEQESAGVALKEFELDNQRNEKRKSVQTNTQQSKLNLESELQQLNNRLTEIKSNLREEQQQAPLTKSIVDSVEGVYGEFSSLFEVTNTRFSLPVGVGLLKILDNLVVADGNAANKTSEFLKSKFMSRRIVILGATKMNMETVHQTHTELRSLLGPRGYLAVDAISVSKNVPMLKEFISFFLQGVVLCENLKTGFQISKSMGSKVKKVITLDGTVLKNGDIEDLGVESQHPRKLTIFVDKNKRMGKKVQGNGDNLVDVHVVEDSLDEQREVEVKIQEMENKLKQTTFSQSDDFVHRERRENQEKFIRKQFSGVQMFIQISRHKNDGMERQNVKLIEEIEKSKILINEIEEQKTELLEKLQVVNLNIEKLRSQFYENNKSLLKSKVEFENMIIGARDSDAQISKLTSKTNELRIQISLLSTENIQQEINQLEQNKLVKMDENKKLQNDKINSQLKIVEFKKELEEIERKIVEIERQMEENDKGVSNLSSSIRILESRLSELVDEKKAILEKQEKVRLDRQSYIEEQELKGFPIDRDLKKNIGKRSQKIDTSSSLILKKPEDEPDDLVYDFLRLVRSKNKANIDEISREMVKQDLTEKVRAKNEIKKKLREMTTNIQTAHLLEVEKNKVERVTNELVILQEEITVLFAQEKELRVRLEEVSSVRKKTLLELLEMLQTRISRVYKHTYKDERANATFMLENNALPFADGIVFTATPPTKKFTIGTESLSSGESSMANLALFLCINDVMKSAVILFDEIDAHLDAENVFRLVNVIGKYSSRMQVAFVSHKAFSYSKASVLLGITRNLKNETACCFSRKLLAN